VFCVAHPRGEEIREQGRSKVRGAITSTADQFNDPAQKSTVIAFGNNYLEFLEGENLCPEVWMGLWTSGQLSSFRTAVFLPHLIRALLKKLFTTIGNLLAEAITQLWQSRQLALVELDEENKKNPDPRHVEQK
jgi:hypothetical protein